MTKVTGLDCASADPLSKGRKLLRELALGLERVYNVSIPLPAGLESMSLKELKKFSTGLLENEDHPWSSAISGLGQDSQLTIKASLFLWRKVLPASQLDVPDYIRRVTSEDDPLPTGYLAHVKKIAQEVFPPKWDKGKYIKNVEGYTPTTKSVKENGRGKGGYRKLMPDRLAFGRLCVDPSEGKDAEIDNVLKFMIAKCDGKDRAVTVMSSSAQVLGPLHKALYDHISEQEWLLRGEATPRTFRNFVRSDGEVFVSGDYESASDHLPLSVARVVLKVAFRDSVSIPQYIKRSAYSLLFSKIEIEGEVYQATRQLMGSLLCFPLLCLQNYIGFRYEFGPEVPVRVNGDDIVYRASPERFEKWASFVKTVGLKLSVGKTMVDPKFFSLNSTFFKARRYRLPKLIPVLRCSTLFKSSDANSLAGSLRRFRMGMCRGSALFNLASEWFLRKKRRVIQKSGRSVVRGLGVDVPDVALKGAGLWQRELFYLAHVPNQSSVIGGHSEARLPLPPTSKFRWVQIPKGWKRKEVDWRARGTESEDEFFEALVDNTWEVPPQVLNDNDAEQQYWSELELTGFEFAWNQYRLDRLFKKPKKLFMGFEKRRARLFSKPFYNLARPRRRAMVWCKTEDSPSGQEEGYNYTGVDYAITLLECDDGWHRPFNLYPPSYPVEDFLIYDGW